MAVIPPFSARKMRIHGHFLWRDRRGAALVFSVKPSAQPPAVWVPISMQGELIPGSDYLSPEKNPLRKTMWLQAIGRLKPGIGIAQAKASIDVTFQQYLRSQLSSGVPGGAKRKIPQSTHHFVWRKSRRLDMEMRSGLRAASRLSHGSGRTASAHCLCQCGQFAPRARHLPSKGNRHSGGDRSKAKPHPPPNCSSRACCSPALAEPPAW